MNKKQCFQRLWNNIEDGWPEPDQRVKLLVETKIGLAVTNGQILCRQLSEFDKLYEDAGKQHDGYFCKRWMIIHL